MTDIEKQKETDILSAADVKLIDEVVEYINTKIGENYYKTAIEVGDYVLKHFFDNQIAKVKSKISNKEHSFKRLCENSNLQVHPKHLYQMVLVAAQERLLTNKLKTDQLSKLGYSLKVELLKINIQKTKIDFAKHFIKNKFTVKQAKEYIKNKLGYDPSLDIIPFSSPLIDQFDKIYTWATNKDIAADYSTIKIYKVKTIKENVDKFLTHIDQIDQVKKKLLEIKSKVTQREDEILKAAKAVKEAKEAKEAAAKAAKEAKEAEKAAKAENKINK